MEKELPANHLLCDGKYKIVKNLSFSEDGGIYTARDTGTKVSYLIREFLPPAHLSDQELEKRIASFKEILVILSSFDHPNLSKIYSHFSDGRRQYVVMEQVDGVTLKSLLDMSVQSIPEEQVLQWTMSICSALHYLHNRPKPFIFDVLDSTHIMINGEGQLKLINYGLDRFFADGNAISFTASRELFGEEMEKLAQTVFYLLTRKNMAPFGVTDKDGLSLPLAKLLNKLVSADNERTFRDFQALSEAFDKILHPPVIVERKRGPQKPMFIMINFERLWQNVLYKYLKQPIWLVATEIIGVFVLMFVAYRIAYPPIIPRETEAAYVACGSTINVVDLKQDRVLNRIKISRPIHSMAVTHEGNKLFCSSLDEGLVYQFNSVSNRLINLIPVGSRPRQLLVSPKDDYLYVLHREQGHVSFVELDPEKLPQAPSRKSPRKDKTVGIFSIGGEARGLAVVGGLKVKNSLTESDGASPAALAETGLTLPVVFCSSRLAHSVSSVTFPPITEVANATCQEAGPLVVSPDKKKLYVVSCDSSMIFEYDSATLKQLGTLAKTGGSDIRAVFVTPNSSEVWSLNGSGNIGVVRASDRNLHTTVQLQGTPTSACWRNGVDGGAELWVTTESPNQVEIVREDSHTVRTRIPLYGSPTDIVLLDAPSAEH